LTLQFKAGTYVGDGTDNRNITGVGFTPKFVMTGDATGASDGKAMRADINPATDAESHSIGENSGFLADAIQAIQADGFQVGTSNRVNANAVTYHYMAWGGDATDIKTGSYAGNGADNRGITGVGFQPAWVVVFGTQNAHARHKMNSTGAAVDTGQYFTALANAADSIQSLDADGFTIGTSTDVNAAGQTYHFVAIKSNATNSFNSSFVGNATDNRSIAGVGFQPTGVIVKAVDANAGVYRTSTETGDNTMPFRAGAEFANGVQALEADGFQVGTDARVNVSGVTYHFLAFRAAPAAPVVDTKNTFFMVME